MRRYILLVGYSYYPAAWDDFIGSFDSVEGAKKKAAKCNGDWYEIIDCETELLCKTGMVEPLRAANSEGELDDLPKM